jgi:hypothetical protein
MVEMTHYGKVYRGIEEEKLVGITLATTLLRDAAHTFPSDLQNSS